MPRDPSDSLSSNGSSPSNDAETPHAGDGRHAFLQAAGVLPADDGMASLRARVHAIRALDLPRAEKAGLMHALMNADFAARQRALQKSNETRQEQERHRRVARSLSAVRSDDGRPDTPCSMGSAGPAEADGGVALPAASAPLTPVSSHEESEAGIAFNLRPEDLVPSFQPRREEEPEDEEPELGCAHYKRQVKVQCFDCRRWYTCRQCHDEAEEGHRLDRRRTRNMLCMLCWTPQPAAGFCAQCGEPAAWYYCDLCKLWENDTARPVYHCPDCGICRRGEGLGRDFHHCKQCNVCISIQHKDAHTCLERATEGACPICGDDLFDSPTAVSQMPCGHYLHRLCFAAYMRTAYQCPLCKRSAVNMELQWKKLREAVDSQPMPPPLAGARALVRCNDCAARTTTPYHWLGNQCAHCDSFNTNELRLLDADRPRSAPGPDHADAGGTDFVRREGGPVRSPVLESPPGSYFLRPQAPPARRNSASSMMRAMQFSPYDVLERFSRSLSPIRHYLEFPWVDDEGGGAVRSDGDADEVDFWGADGSRFLSGGEDGDEDEEEESEDDDGDEDDEDGASDADDAASDDDDDAEDDLDPIPLIGHR